MIFKRLISFALLLIFCLTLVSCGMKDFVHEEFGFSITLPEDFELFPYGAKTTVTYKNAKEDCAVVINHFTVDELKPDFGGEDFTLKAYVEKSFEDHGFTGSGIHPTYPSETCAIFEVATGENESDMPQYSYNVVIKENGMVYVVQMICSANDMESYKPKFEKWAKNIKVI